MAIARNLWGHIERRDHRVMRRLNRWRAPRWIRYWMIAATRMGDGWLWYGLGVMLLIFGGPSRYEAVAASGSAAIAGVLVFKILKLLSQRSRPLHNLKNNPRVFIKRKICLKKNNCNRNRRKSKP